MNLHRRTVEPQEHLLLLLLLLLFLFLLHLWSRQAQVHWSVNAAAPTVLVHWSEVCGAVEGDKKEESFNWTMKLTGLNWKRVYGPGTPSRQKGLLSLTGFPASERRPTHLRAPPTSPPASPKT